MGGEAKAKGGCNASHTGGGYGALGDGVFPTSCWRPYAEESPFNDRLSRTPQVKNGSTGTIEQLTSQAPGVSYFVAGDEAKDRGVAMYYSDASDPVYAVHCTEPWGTCAVEGAQVHLPDGAEPSGVWPLPNPNADYDSHLTVVDQATGWEYDLWNVRKMENGEIIIKWGGKTRVDGDGLGSDAVSKRPLRRRRRPDPRRGAPGGQDRPRPLAPRSRAPSVTRGPRPRVPSSAPTPACRPTTRCRTATCSTSRCRTSASQPSPGGRARS